MSTIRSLLKEILDVCSDLNNAPPPPASLSTALSNYLKALNEAKKRYAEEETFRNLFAELVNVDEALGRRKLEQLTDLDFKKFCSINKITSAKGTKEKRVKGKVLQKAVKAKKATKGKSAQLATPVKREPDTVIPAKTSRQATTEIILSKAFQLKSQTTL